MNANQYVITGDIIGSERVLIDILKYAILLTTITVESLKIPAVTISLSTLIVSYKEGMPRLKLKK
jgi:hypothetical protein